MTEKVRQKKNQNPQDEAVERLNTMLRRINGK